MSWFFLLQHTGKGNSSLEVLSSQSLFQLILLVIHHTELSEVQVLQNERWNKKIEKNHQVNF